MSALSVLIGEVFAVQQASQDNRATSRAAQGTEWFTGVILTDNTPQCAFCDREAVVYHDDWTDGRTMFSSPAAERVVTCDRHSLAFREQAAPCELCGATPAPYRYGCLPHVRWEHLCEACAEDIVLDMMIAGDGPITQTPDWYLCGPGEKVPRG